MSGHPRLYRRNATYYHRAAIPVDIKGTYPKTEETFSLKTKDYREALRLVRIKAVEVDRKFEDHRQEIAKLAEPALEELSEEQLTLIHDVYYAHLLQEDEETRLEGFEDNDEAESLLPVPTFEEYSNEIGEDLESSKALLARGKSSNFLDDEAEEVLSWSNVNLSLEHNSPSWRLVKRELVKAQIRASQAKRERNAGEIIETPKAPAVGKKNMKASSSPLLSVASRDWIEEKSRTSWVSKTKREHEVWMRHFIDIAGDKPINEYAKSDARAFKAVLMSIPPNWSTKRKLKGIRTLSDAAEKASRLGLSAMSDKNVNKLLGFVGSFWSWAEGQFDDVPENLFKGIQLKINQRAREEREPFTSDELRAIFHAPIYTGCRSQRYWGQPGNVVLRDTGLFWLPLISLFTGARMGEIIQLQTSDVKSTGDITYFNLTANADDQHLKTKASWRSIPVHPQLIQMGFMDLVSTRRTEKSQRLFPDLKKGNDGYWSSGFSSPFRRFLISVGVKREKNAFHSFRHNFEDACRDSKVPSDIMDALQGHIESGMKARYGSGHRLDRLDEAMKKVEYRGLDLSHLMVTN